ncbi:unnamed protein product [Danaus chrysippus]|uniref:(African queen) hypothetical protein n=1 Tax=Danaus chrysippus TaxID=151541 RepID=A0A8J2WAL8_9NEOP|nr:unnamed protein product [Danaus chrysippus]
MEKKSTVVKSKSSNSAIVTKKDKKNAKCFSNYDIITNSKKKRGVYVEKSPNREDVIKPPKRSRPGKKKFLASVLTILSKSTAATQYPEIDNSDRIKDRIKPRSTQKSDTNKHKKKYKSRVLNTYKDDSIIVLKSKKEIQQTSSTSSRNDTCKSYTPQNKKSNQKSIRYVLDNNIYSGVAEGPARDILKIESKKHLSAYEPKDTNVEKQVDKKIYNFFVELLETTFNMYNDKELNDNTKESKTGLELNESVLQKLIIQGQSQVENQRSYSKDIDSEKYKFLSSFYERTLNNDLPETPKVRPKTKYLINHKKDKPEKLNSFSVPKKGKKSKKALLDILKEELTKDACKTYEEPGNLYQALKVMAKNKKKSENSIRFNKMEGFSDKDCMLRRKVLFKSKKRNRKTDPKTKFISRSFEIGSNRFPSRHSLVVYGYDYEKPIKIQQPVETKHTGVPLASSSSNEDSDIYCSSFDFPISPTNPYSYND